MQVSDPPLLCDAKSIGTKVHYNALRHDPFDGFIKNKEECIIVLPSLHRAASLQHDKQHATAGAQENEFLAKALVLQVNYEIPN